MGGNKPKSDEDKDGYLENRKRWSNAIETARFADDKTGKKYAVRVTVGEDGYTLTTNHPDHGEGKTTGHAAGDLHRHGDHSDGPKDDFVRSADGFAGYLGRIIKWWNGK